MEKHLKRVSHCVDSSRDKKRKRLKKTETWIIIALKSLFNWTEIHYKCNWWSQILFCGGERWTQKSGRYGIHECLVECDRSFILEEREVVNWGTEWKGNSLISQLNHTTKSYNKTIYFWRRDLFIHYNSKNHCKDSWLYFMEGESCLIPEEIIAN